MFWLFKANLSGSLVRCCYGALLVERPKRVTLSQIGESFFVSRFHRSTLNEESGVWPKCFAAERFAFLNSRGIRNADFYAEGNRSRGKIIDFKGFLHVQVSFSTKRHGIWTAKFNKMP